MEDGVHHAKAQNLGGDKGGLISSHLSSVSKMKPAIIRPPEEGSHAVFMWQLRESLSLTGSMCSNWLRQSMADGLVFS